MRTIVNNDHIIEVNTYFPQIVKYDGKEVSRGYSLLGSTYVFSAEEDKEKIQYEINIKPGLFQNLLTVRRNGKLVYKD